MTEMQAAIGVAQMDKLSLFCDKRKENFKKYYNIFSKYPQYFILPEATEKADPAWFSFIITIKTDAPFKRDQFTKYLDENLIETRNLFAGNLTKQPAFIDKTFRIAKTLDTTDYIMNNTFFLGTYPGMDESRFSYVESVVDRFISQLKS
jgi:CDP-6-deoxy-D-xylo-4-hexulose-3-dehydrase